jgi:hypothetical protein
VERLTFAGIEQKNHPMCINYLEGVFDNREIIDVKDDEIVQNIIDVYSYFENKAVLASGEWNWIQENMQKDYKRLLTQGDKDALIPLYRNFFRNQVSFGISAPDSEVGTDSYNLVNDTLLDIDTWREFCGELPISELETIKIGNPFGVVVDGILVMYNSCRHFYHAQKIKSLVEFKEMPIIFEIGAGYGGVFYFLSQMRDNFCYVVCDLMETLFTNYYYTMKWSYQLDKNIAIKWAYDGVISAEDINKYHLILVPSISHENITVGFDVAYNANSFSEMSYHDISLYFDTINKNKPEYIFHQNSNFRLWNISSRGHVEVLAQDFPIPQEYRLTYQAISPWTGAGGRYREYLYTHKG